MQKQKGFWQQDDRADAAERADTADSGSRSNRNQSRVKINFSAIEVARPVLAADFPYTETDFIEMSHDESIDFLNKQAAEGIFPPLNILKMIIKKFQNDRYGVIEDVEKLYKIILKKYQGVIGGKSKEVIEIHSEMMLVYLRRYNKKETKRKVEASQENIEKKLLEIYHSFPDIYTYNVLMDMSLTFERYEKVIDLFHSFPEAFEKDQWTYSRYFRAKFKQYPKIAREIYEKEIPENFKYELAIIKAMFEVLKQQKNSKAIQEFFDHIPKEHRGDGAYRLLIKAYFDLGLFSEAIKIYDSWPSNIDKKQPTFCMMIEQVYPHGPQCAIAIYREALSLGLFKKNVVNIDESSIADFGLVIVKINFHYEEPKALGTPVYGAFTINVIQVMLDDLKERVDAIQQKHKSAQIQVHLITGIGKGVQREMVKGLLEKKFDWNASQVGDNSGEIYVKLPILAAAASAAPASNPSRYVPPHLRADVSHSSADATVDSSRRHIYRP